MFVPGAGCQDDDFKPSQIKKNKKKTGCVFERYKSYRIYTCRHSDHIFIVVFIIIQCSAQNVEVLYKMNKEKGTHNNHEHIQESWSTWDR